MEYKFTLKDLRTATNANKYDIAAKLQLESYEYFEIESGRRKPSIDTLRDLAAMYGTSMDFIYHAFYGMGVKYTAMYHILDYAMRQDKRKDMLFVGNWHRPPIELPDAPTGEADAE